MHIVVAGSASEFRLIGLGPHSDALCINIDVKGMGAARTDRAQFLDSVEVRDYLCLWNLPGSTGQHFKEEAEQALTVMRPHANCPGRAGPGFSRAKRQE